MGQAITQPGPPGTKFCVIGAGMCRIGTKTLNQALTILLKGPVHDSGIQSLGGSYEEVHGWIEIMRLAPLARTFSDRKYLEYRLASILDGYVATVDAPALTLTPELMQVFPDAVVIATTRDHDSWWESMNCLNGMLGSWYLPWLILWVPRLGMYRQWRKAFVRLAEWRWGEPGIFENTLKNHEDHLRRVVPKDRLFWFNVKDGWDPLCEFLGVPVPDEDFPHNNSREDASQSYRDTISAGIFCWLVVIGMGLAGLWLTWKTVPIVGSGLMATIHYIDG